MTTTTPQATKALGRGRRPGKSDSPAVLLSRRLSEAFKIFNEDLFEGALPPAMLQLRNKPGSYGYFQPNKWKGQDESLLDVISLDSSTATERPLIELLSTLVHEMAHSYVFNVVKNRRSTGGHGPDWRLKMQEIGLPPVQIGNTWRQATHRIDPAGAYAQAFERNRARLQELPWSERIGTATRGRGLDRVKFQCPVCLANAYARPAALLLCGECSTITELVEMLPEYRPSGGGGKGSGKAATAKREHYPEPTGIPSLPVWTDELSRELRLLTGLDHPPVNVVDALTVLTFGMKERGHGALLEALLAPDQSAEDLRAVLKRVYLIRAKQLHPDAGGSEVAFKALQTAYMLTKRGGK